MCTPQVDPDDWSSCLSNFYYCYCVLTYMVAWDIDISVFSSYFPPNRSFGRRFSLGYVRAAVAILNSY